MPSKINQFKDNTMMDVLKGAGLFLYYNYGLKNKYLVLLNSQTNIWEPTNGNKDLSESYLACALRECVEETSINVNLKRSSIYAPFSIEYKISNNIQKAIKIFPTRIRNQKSVVLSNEHKCFKWIDLAEAKQLNASNTLKTCYFDIICKIESIHKKETVNYREIITKILKNVVVNNHLTCKYKWFLTGSISANEYTVYENEILSDIDLVAVGDTIPKPNKIYKINKFIHYNLIQTKEFHKLTVGTMFLNQHEAIDSHTPFGSYLEKFSSIINSSSIELKFVLNGSDDNSYNIFRLFWYTSLRSNFFDCIESNYYFLKANLLLFYFKNRVLFSHFSYSSIRNQIILDLSSNLDSKEEASLLLLLKAADTKLNYGDFLLDINWEVLFFNEFKILLNKLTKEQYIIASEINKIISNNIEVSPALLKLFRQYFDNHDIIDLYIKACNMSSINFIWVLLILLRMKIWPEQVQFSEQKYRGNIKLLLNNNELLQNENIKRKLNSLFFELGWDYF